MKDAILDLITQERTAKALGLSVGLTVEISGNTAYTEKKNGKTKIVLPVMDRERMELVQRGILDHEVAHVRYTDFAALEDIDDKCLHSVFNVIEDIRVEKKYMQRHKGAITSLQRLSNTLFVNDKDATSFHNLFQEYVFCLLYLCRQKLFPMLKWENLLCKFKTEVMDFCAQFVDDVHNVNSTKESVLLARFICSQLDGLQEKDKQESGFSLAQEAWHGGTASDTDLSSLLGKYLDRCGQDAGTGLLAQWKEAFKPLDRQAVFSACRQISEQERRFGSKICASIIREFRTCLESATRDRLYHADKGRLAQNRLALYKTTDNVFQRTEYGQKLNTIVSILIDCSGSTGTSFEGDVTVTGAESAAAFAVAKTLDSLHIKYAIDAFNSNSGLLTLKRFDDKADFTYFLVPKADGGTPTAQALVETASKMPSKNSGKRRIVLLLTDGEADDMGAFAEVSKALIADGINVAVTAVNKGRLSSSIVPEALKGAFQTANSVQSIASAMFASLKHYI